MTCIIVRIAARNCKKSPDLHGSKVTESMRQIHIVPHTGSLITKLQRYRVNAIFPRGVTVPCTIHWNERRLVDTDASEAWTFGDRAP